MDRITYSKTRKQVLDNIIPQLAWKRLLPFGYLDDKVSIDFLDMAVIFRCMQPETGEIPILTKEMAQVLSIGTNDAYCAALRNSRPYIRNLQEIPEGMVSTGKNLPQLPVPVLYMSDERIRYGAGVMLDRGAIWNASRMLGGDMVILPYSTDGVLACPLPGGTDPMVFQGGIPGMDGKIQLTGSVYVYDADDDEIRIARPHDSEEEEEKLCMKN